MNHGLKYIFVILLTLAGFSPVRAQYYSINIDAKTAAAMAASYNAEAVTEMYYNEQLSKIRESYQAAEVAAAGIFSSKFLDRKALTDLGLWSSATENYYYRRIYNMVSAKIMPKIWTVAGMMIKHPENALYWGTYLYKVCDETKQLCYQFESIVTNSSLSFKDIAFLEISDEIKSVLKLTELGGVDWKAILDNFSEIPNNFSKENLKKDIDQLYSMGASLAGAGASNVVNAILQKSEFNDLFHGKLGAAVNIIDNYGGLINSVKDNLGGTLLQMIGGQDALSNLFNLSNYNMTAWATDYAREGMGQYYTQRWYIYRVDQGSVSLCDYVPPTGKDDVIYGDHWTRFNTTDPNFWPNSQQSEQSLQNSENHAGWSRNKVNQLNNSNDGFTYRINYYRLAYNITRNGNLRQKAYAYEIHVTKSWYNKETTYEDVFDSYSMSLEAFKNGMNARLKELNDNENGYTYYIGTDSKKYYQTTDARKLAGVETVTISVTCHDGTTLGEGKTQYKCGSCGGSVSEHTKQCVMATSVSESSVNTSELDSKITEAESHITMLQSQINALQSENSELLRKIASASVNDAAQYRQQYNANQDRISALQTEKTQWENDLAQYRKAKSEAVEGEEVPTDDYYRIPAIMQDCRSAYSLTWNGSGSWNGNTYVRTATMPNIKGTVTFKATVSIARKPKYFLFIKIHRAIVQIDWKLTTEYSDTQVVEVMDLDPTKSEQEKANEVNAKIAEIQRSYPDCQVSTQYAKTEPTEQDDTGDVNHLLWSSDRLEIAREVDNRLTKIYADLVSLEKMMSYKHDIIDLLKTIAPYIHEDAGRRFTLVEQCRRRWLSNASGILHSDSYNGKYDEDEEE